MISGCVWSEFARSLVLVAGVSGRAIIATPKRIINLIVDL